MVSVRNSSRHTWTASQKAAVLATAGLGGYALYRYIYRSKDEDGHSLSLQEQLQGFRDSVLRIPAAVANYYAAYVSLSRSARLVATDLHIFLTSDSPEVPRSLLQCGRLLQTGATLLAQGALQAAPPFGTEDVMGSLMRLLETLDTVRGRSLLGFVIDRACQQSMRTFVESLVATGGNTADLAALPVIMMDKYLEWASSPGGQAASVAMVSAFGRSAVEAYMSVTEGSNFWEDLLRVLAKPEYRSFLGIECEVTTRAFVMSLFEAMGRGVRISVNGESSGSDAPQHGNITAAAPTNLECRPHLTRADSGTMQPSFDPALLASAMVQVVKVREARQLITSLCGTATSTGIRTTMYCMRDIIAESPQTFIVILALVVALPMYLATRHGLQVIV
eukprot:jgi/Botrbrau1/391/Bobra.110_2s0046.1